MLERCWKILDGFWEFFGRILMDFWEDFGTQTIIRATKETSMDGEVLIIGKVVGWSVGVPTSLISGDFRLWALRCMLWAVISIGLIFQAFF